VIILQLISSCFDFPYLPCRKDEREFIGMVYHKVSRRLETAVQMEWTAGSNDTKFAIAAKYCPDMDTTFRVLIAILVFGL